MSHPHVIYGSPLVHVDRINHVIRPKPTKEQLKRLEDEFILDCIITEKLRYKWSPDIIPKYDALFDHHAASYFKSPTVQLLLQKTLPQQIQLRHHASSPVKPFPFRRPQLEKLTLSGRRRLPPEKTEKELEEKRVNFVNNHVFLTNQVTKDKPLIDPYNAIFDNHSAKYFRKADVKKLLSNTMPSGIHPKVRDKGGCSIDGPVIDRFIESGAGYRYLHARNEAPRAAKAGHSTDQVNGHGQFMSDARPNFGYHGHFGYRRNTPWLRQMPSPFGVDPRSPTH